MKATLYADGRVESGGAALVLHNERLADQLDPVTRLLASISSKRKKTEADHGEMARVEFFGGLYMGDPTTFLNDPITAVDGQLISPDGAVPCVPAWNLLRCLQEGAKRHKRGPDVLRGIHPLTEVVPITYDGPRDPNIMWKEGTFSLRKGVGVMRNRLMRTRPIFTEWSLTFPIEIDPVVLDIDTVTQFWRDSGRYAGLGEMRPVYGRFRGTLATVDAEEDE